MTKPTRLTITDGFRVACGLFLFAAIGSLLVAAVILLLGGTVLGLTDVRAGWVLALVGLVLAAVIVLTLLLQWLRELKAEQRYEDGESAVLHTQKQILIELRKARELIEERADADAEREKGGCETTR